MQAYEQEDRGHTVERHEPLIQLHDQRRPTELSLP